MMQKISNSMEKRTTVRNILMGLQSLQSANALAPKKTSVPSGATPETLTVVAMIEKRQTIKEWKFLSNSTKF